MDDGEPSPRLFECQDCGNLGLGRGEIRCCDGAMARVDAEAVLDEPTLEEVLRVVFDVSDTELEVCLCVMDADGLTVSDLADRIDYDRSVVARHLTHLADLGVIERRRQILERGGHVYLYTPVSEEQVRRRLSRAFAAWVREALEVVGTVQREKVESIAETDDPAWEIIRER